MTRLGKTRMVWQDGWPLGDSLTLRTPIAQAVLGTCDGPRLAAAVSPACREFFLPKRLSGD
jgi:hypothetical protein